MKNNNILISQGVQAIVDISKNSANANEYKITFIMNFNTSASKYIKQIEFSTQAGNISTIKTSDNISPTLMYEIIAKLNQGEQVVLIATDNKDRKYIYKTKVGAK